MGAAHEEDFATIGTRGFVLVIFRRHPPPLPQEKVVPVQIDGETRNVQVKESTKARRVILRMDKKLGDIVVVRPKGVPLVKVQDFVRRNQDWIEKQFFLKCSSQ